MRRLMLQSLTVKSAGFTLVELVTTIILISILAVTALPRLFSSSSYSAYSLRNEFIGELRRVQQKALNNTDRCYRLVVSDSAYREYWAERLTADGSCNAPYVPSSSEQLLAGGAKLALISANSNNFDLDFNLNGSLQLSCDGNCINVIADDTVIIGVSAGGYIYAQ